MKQIAMLFTIVVLVLVGFASPATMTTYAQDGPTGHDAIIASIPTLFNFAEQAETTYVGDVEGSYAYIAFVVSEDLVVVYVCDSVAVGVWFRGEVVDGAINLMSESGVQVDAVVEDGQISGTAVIPVDDDGSEAVAHDFVAIPAVAGITGLARYVDEATDSIGGWIVTEEGIRGLFGRRQRREQADACATLQAAFDEAVNNYVTSQDASQTGYFFLGMQQFRQAMIDLGCGSPT
jgi:hypothetical protein